MLGLVGQSFTDQAVLYVPSANPLGAVATSSNRWTIRAVPNRRAGMNTIYGGQGTATSPNGFLTFAMATVQLQ